MEDRDDVNLKQFKSRSTNKKVVEKPNNPKAPAPMQIYVIYDDMGICRNDHISMCGWTRVGTSPRITPADVCRSKRRIHMFMNDA
jgi:hypothetical protein